MSYMTCTELSGVWKRRLDRRDGLAKPLRRSAVLVAWIVLAGCDGSQPEPPLVVYFDVERRQPVVMPTVDQHPVIHPETDRPTLRPAMHCPTCEVWRQAPPPEQLNRSAAPAVCPKCRSRLQIEGPLPSP